MNEEERHPVDDKAADWPPPPELPQSMYSNFLQSEAKKIKQSGHELNKIDLLKRLRAEYPLPLEVAMKVLDEFCVNYAPELQKGRRTGQYILSAMFLWLIVSVVALLKHNYILYFLLVCSAILLCMIKMIIAKLRM